MENRRSYYHFSIDHSVDVKSEEVTKAVENLLAGLPSSMKVHSLRETNVYDYRFEKVTEKFSIDGDVNGEYEDFDLEADFVVDAVNRSAEFIEDSVRVVDGKKRIPIDDHEKASQLWEARQEEEDCEDYLDELCRNAWGHWHYGWEWDG